MCDEKVTRLDEDMEFQDAGEKTEAELGCEAAEASHREQLAINDRRCQQLEQLKTAAAAADQPDARSQQQPTQHQKGQRRCQ